MSDRLTVVKTCKLFIGGAFPRSESGRVLPVASPRRKDAAPVAYVAHASRKDLRDAVEAAARAQPGWAARDAYNRGQVLHRLAEVLEDRRAAFTDAIRAGSTATAAVARREVDAAVDRLISYAGWADKYGHVLGTHDPVSGPYYAFTVPEATGVVVLLPPASPALLGLVQMTAASICTGNAVILIAPAGPGTNPLPAVQVSEACGASDIPSGVVNLLTGLPSELVPHIARHRGIDAVGAAASGLDAESIAVLRGGAAENLKRVHVETADGARWYDAEAMSTPWSLEPFVEFKTIWHPAAT